jgi:putative ABC transport system permease protein
LRRLAFRGLAARKLRAFTTGLAIFLGVALVAGTYVLTDTINASFKDIFTESLKGTNVVVTSRETVQQQDREPPAFPASYLPRVKKVDGVEDAAGAIFSLGRIVDRKGDTIGNSFAPNFIASVLPRRFETLTLVKGRFPRNASETSLDSQTAERGKVAVGGRIGVAGETSVHFYRVVGITKLGEASFGGAAIAQLVLPEAQRVTDKVGKFDQISVASSSGVSSAQLRDRIRRVLPPTVKVETGSQNANRQTKDIESDLSFLKIALLVFAGVSLFVGAFLIFNTFSITVAQRIREFGLLRTLGASRRQVLRTVILEALAIGVIGSLLGLAGGVGFAPAINALFKAVGIDLPNTGTVLKARTVIVALIVGVGVTVVASLVPALRATRVSPMAALREAELPEARRRGRVLAALATVLAAGGVAATCVGLFGGIEDSGSAAGLLGGGAVAVLLGVSIFSPSLVKPLASVAGWPIERLRGLAGRLARENALRKPGRTAVTAAALMIGLAIVSFVTVFAAGIKDSIASAVDRNFQGDVVVQNVDGFSPIPTRVAATIRRVPGAETVSTLRAAGAKYKGSTVRATALDPRTANEVLSLDWKRGSPDALRTLGPGEAIADDAWIKGKGDTIRVLTPSDKRVTLRVVGTVKDNADLLGNFVVTQATLRRDFGETLDSIDFVKVSGPVAPVQRRITDALERPFPTVEVLNQKELKDKQAGQINALLGLIYALLSLAVVVSLFGIVNTLALSIHERTRELGMLRAIGMSRRQVRRVIRYEAVITALIGAILGAIIGVIFAVLVSVPLADEGFALSIPVPTLLLLLVLAAIAGVLAAIGPARRASRLDVLRALAYE